MKATMGFFFFLLFLAGLALVMLMGRQLTPPGMGGGGASLTGKEWRLSVLGPDNVPVGAGIYMTFEVDGSVKGHAGCNRFFGSLEQNDGVVSFGTIGSTRMACEETVMRREANFLQALEKTQSFESDNERLKLLDENRVILAELRAAAE